MAKKKKIKVDIPQNLNDIKLSQWQEFILIEDNVDMEFKLRRALSIFFGIRGDQYKDFRAADIEMLFNELKTVLEEEAKFQTRFILDEVEYGFIPNLDKITFGVFCDLEGSVEPETYHKLMSILYRPISEKVGTRYDIKPYSGTHDNLRDMPLGIALGAVGFFLILGNQLVNSILSSHKETELVQMPSATSMINGVGILQSIPSLVETCWTLDEWKT